MLCSLYTLFSLVVNTRVTTTPSCLDRTHCIYVLTKLNPLQMKTKFKLVTNDYNYISFNFRMRQCWWILYSIISVSLSFSPPFFIFYDFSPWAGWQRDMPPSSVDIITFLHSHPLLPIEHMHRCHAAVIEHVHLVPCRELHQGTYQSLKKNTGRKRAILHQIVFML